MLHICHGEDTQSKSMSDRVHGKVAQWLAHSLRPSFETCLEQGRQAAGTCVLVRCSAQGLPFTQLSMHVGLLDVLLWPLCQQVCLPQVHFLLCRLDDNWMRLGPMGFRCVVAFLHSTATCGVRPDQQTEKTGSCEPGRIWVPAGVLVGHAPPADDGPTSRCGLLGVSITYASLTSGLDCFCGLWHC
jgi:hypothetical protein